MPTSDQIQRIRIDPDGLDFETLRKEAISKVQDLCGEIWTDYNLHDPGVTILEQLCYGLTELSYRSGFEIQDYLVNEKNRIDYPQQALFSPEEILPSAAVTEVDYQKILYDAIPEIDYVWLEPCAVGGGAAARGLYTIYVKIDDELIQSHAEKPKNNSNLSELSGKLERLGITSNSMHALLDQLGDHLDTWYETMKKGGGLVEGACLQLGEAKQLDAQIGKTLQQLDSSLACVDNLWSQINSIWPGIIDSPDTPDLTSRFDAVLSKLHIVFSYAKLIDALKPILSELESNSDNLISLCSDLLAKLTIPLTRFDIALSKLDKTLRGIKKDLFSSTEPLDQVAGKLDEIAIKQRILSVFAKHRNLCEDVHRIEIFQTIPYYLGGEVEIRPAYNTAKIYAEIFLKCAHYISSGIQIDRYESILSQTGSYEQIFSGPLTTHGYISDRCFEMSQEVLSIVDLIPLINQIEGVVKVHDLYLIDQENKKYTSILYDSLKLPDLCFPETGKSMQILQLVLRQGASRKDQSDKTTGFEFYENKQDEALLEEALLELRKLLFEYHAFRNNRQSFAQLIQLPGGQRRVLEYYFSIQNQFPAIYGINRYGIPRSASPKTKAKAKQLKAYLFPFEQLMANYLQNLQEIPRLFSLDSELEQSYFSQFLANQNIPDIESLYVKGKQHSQALLSEILVHYDHFIDRRNRVLDTLLAMYGEQYPQRSLLEFDCYRRTDPGRWIIENKINFLKCIREITRDRAKGFNYLEPLLYGGEGEREENIAGAHKRISILLGLSQFNRISSITDVLIKRNSRLIPDRVLAEGISLFPEEIENKAVSVFFDEEKFIEMTIPAKLPAFGHAVFKEGVELKNYRLVSSGQKTIVCLKSEQNACLWPLGSKDSLDEAVLYAHEFCSTLTQLNIACENFHMIEHVLLRPRGDDGFGSIPDGESFFDFRISVIFPSWTARFSNKEFRKFAQETVIKNFPAHIFPEFYWLDFVYMQDFEQRYRIWLFCMRQANLLNNQSNRDQLDKASERLISFLLKNRKETECECWI